MPAVERWPTAVGQKPALRSRRGHAVQSLWGRGDPWGRTQGDGRLAGLFRRFIMEGAREGLGCV